MTTNYVDNKNYKISTDHELDQQALVAALLFTNFHVYMTTSIIISEHNLTMITIDEMNFVQISDHLGNFTNKFSGVITSDGQGT